MLVLMASYLLLVFLLPLALSAVISYRSLPRGRACPECGGDSIQLLSRALRPWKRLMLSTELQRRWCLCCGWSGLQRVSRHAGTAPTGRPESVQAGPRTSTLNVRSIDVDGSAWRVMLQCWTTTGLLYGRLVFVSPSGRLWLDAVESFGGSSGGDALGQIRSLSDPLLTRRLRRLALRREA